MARLSPESYDREIYEGIIEQPIFWYNIVMRQIRKGNETTYLDGRDNTRNSASFDPSEAKQTMFAVLTTNSDVPDQFFGTPDPPDETDGTNSGGWATLGNGVCNAVVWSTVIATITFWFFSV